MEKNLILAEKLVKKLKNMNWRISALESATGGHFINTITCVSGASEITLGSFITYSNEMKIRIGVSEEIINNYGVYSKECAKSMAKVAIQETNSNIGVGITGTFSNIDSKNEDSKKGEVHYAIGVNENIYENTIKVPIKNFSRFEQKNYVVKCILEKCLDLF